jgi:hypothetical protein
MAVNIREQQNNYHEGKYRDSHGSGQDKDLRVVYGHKQEKCCHKNHIQAQLHQENYALPAS